MDRTEFAKILNSIIIPEGISNDELNKKVLPISEAVRQMIPSSLFRYRCCDEEGLQIDAFKNDKICAVTADKFNDPYDTLVGYDLNHIKQYLDTILSKNTLTQLKEGFKQGYDFPKEIQQALPKGTYENFKTNFITYNIQTIEQNANTYKQQLIQQLEFWFPILAESSKKFVTSACFCERFQSMTMWSHYADYHKGFALEYNSDQFLGLKNIGIYPIIYDNKRYDASLLITWAFFHIKGVTIPKPDMLAHIKCVLHKSMDWECEKEWRMLDYSQSQQNIFNISKSCISLKPKAIYYGFKISPENKKQLHEIAKSKKIAEYDMYIDYSSSKYEMLYKPTNLI